MTWKSFRTIAGLICASVLLAGMILGAGGVLADETDAMITGTRNAPEGDARSVQTLSSLAGTKWRLVSFQSMDDAIGTIRPDDPSLYTMELKGDGTVAMRLNCNRAKGTWSAEPAGDGKSGKFSFGPLGVTRALCPAPSMDERIAADAGYIRSYVLKEGKLYLSLMADAGIYAWETDSDVSPASTLPAAPEDGGPRYWKVTGVSSVLNLRKGPSTGASIITRLAPGTLLSNLGCVQSGGEVWCDVQPLGGGPRGYVFSAYVKPAASPDGSVATGPDDSALRAGQGDFDASGHLHCAQDPDRDMTACAFGVARAGGGDATVVVTKPDGRKRAIYFRMGAPVGADTSQAEGYPEFSGAREGDLFLIRIGEERFKIPAGILSGG